MNITPLTSTNISQNPPRFFAIFVDFYPQNAPTSTPNRSVRKGPGAPRSSRRGVFGVAGSRWFNRTGAGVAGVRGTSGIRGAGVELVHQQRAEALENSLIAAAAEHKNFGNERDIADG
jgi:hypothetical protein